jgi:hypothetical protein
MRLERFDGMRRISSLIAGALVLVVACTEQGLSPVVTAIPSVTSIATAPGTVTPAPTPLFTASPSATAVPTASPTRAATALPTAPPKAIDPTRTPVPEPSPTAIATSEPLPQPVPTQPSRVTTPVSAAPPLDASRRRELAPIHDLSVRIAESSPPQAFVDVTTGLPSGCAQFDSAVLDRSGSTLTLTMWNSQPSGNMACTAIYGYVRHTVPLGSMAPGTYSLRVNSETRTFTVQ